MEPMALGSPTNPSSSYHGGVNPALNQSQQHLQHGQQQGGAQYLPGYLMGDVSIQSGGRSFQTSPMKVMKGSSNSGYLTVSPPSSASNTTPKPSNRMVSKPDKPGGPPVQRLFSAPGLSSAPATPSDFMQVSSTPQVSFSMAPNNEMSADHYEDSDPGTWVTVFGFPPTAASYILTQTGMWGHILEHRIPSQGNWMHLKFASRLQARKALARNGRLLTDTLMIGVVPCTDLSIVEDVNRKENTFQTQHQGTPSHMNLQRVTSTPQPLKWGDRSQSSFALASTSMTPTANNSALDRSSLRPLTQAFKGAQADYEVTQNRGTPQQNTSLVSKAMDFVFGW